MNLLNNETRWVREALFEQATNSKHDIALRYCDKDHVESYSYRQLISLGYSLATRIEIENNPPGPAILLIPGGSPFVISFIACIIRGVSAVPVHLTNHFKLGRSIDTLSHILADSQCEYIFTLSSLSDEIKKQGWQRTHQIIFVDQQLTDSSRYFPTKKNYDALYYPSHLPVYLQYSSGSTAKPKAVCNYDHNMRVQHHILLESHLDCQPKIITANWLPFYHDLGMFSGLLLPLLSGGCCNFMPSVHFIAEPFRWLKMINDYQANSGAAPDFAWDLCTTMVTDEQIRQLDLSSIKMAMNGAEPIRPETMANFAAHFASTGFDAHSFTPGYGLAEATLTVSHKPIDTDYCCLAFNPMALAAGKAILDPQGRRLISSGHVVRAWQLQIVDPQTCQPLPEASIGEVWVRGDSVAGGYWQQPELTKATFHNTLAGNSHHDYLRTGDLAFVYQGELFICGRLKDLIIVAGQNYMPKDIETAIEYACDDIHTGGVCVCQHFESGEFIVMAEVYRHLTSTALQRIAQQIVATVARHFQLKSDTIILLARGKLLKTSSGKIRRSHMLSLYFTQQLSVLYVLASQAETQDEMLFDQESVLFEQEAILFDWLHKTGCELLGCEAINPDSGLHQAGLTSLLATQFCQRINHFLGCHLNVADLFAYPTLRQLTLFLSQHQEDIASSSSTEAGDDRDVAIVAISCRLPGQVGVSWADYCTELSAGNSAVRHENNRLRHCVLPIGALEDIDQFDASFFNISEREAILLDPQQRHILELSWHLFEQAGWQPEQLKQGDIGFYIGQSGSEYGQMLLQKNDPDYAKSYLATGICSSATSGRLAKFYGTRGPALTIDTACSSSLVALDSAMLSLQQKQCSAAVVGGVNLLLSAQIEQTLINAGMLSPKGRCATFSDDADGYARGEGAVLFLLKPYRQAVRDGDPVLAIIEGSVVAQDGESSSLTAPNPHAQAAMMSQLLQRASLAPDDISLLETHGTGTSLGDPVELSAIDRVYGQRKTPLRLGASKSQVGHLEAAAGGFALARAVAQIQQQKAFGHPTLNIYNPLIAEKLSRYYFDKDTCPWVIERVAINAFSFTGTMAAAVLRKPTAVARSIKSVTSIKSATSIKPVTSIKSATSIKSVASIEPVASTTWLSDEEAVGWLPISAKTEAALLATARQLAEALSQHTALARAVVAAWRTKRSHHFPIRALIQYHSLGDLIAQLHQVTGEKNDPRCRFEKAQSPKQWLAGGAFDWASVPPSEGAVSAEVLALLPLYPFTRQCYWAEGLLAESAPLSSPSVMVDTLDFSFVRTWVAETLAIASGALSDEDDLLSLGLDSLQMLDLVDECKKRHITLTLARLFEKTTLGAWEQYWDSVCRSGVCGEGVGAVTPLTEEQTAGEYWQGEPFVLTPVQQAYW